MAWYYNSDTGAVQQQNQAIAWLDLHAGLGWHGPFATKQAALDFYNQGHAANPGWKAPAGLGANITNALKTAAGNATGQAGPVNLPNPLTGVNAIGDFFGRLTEASTWIRVAEVIAGIGLIIIGLAKLAAGTPVGRAATRAGKAAMIL